MKYPMLFLLKVSYLQWDILKGNKLLELDISKPLET